MADDLKTSENLGNEAAESGENAIGDDLTTEEGQKARRENNTLQIWGNKDTMNLNHLVLENILQSPYLRNKLNTLKTFHELVDEIYYNVTHLEPWEKGTRKTTGQTGMCGGVRGVGAGGVVSTPFCILYRLFTLKLTRKQLYTLLNHADSPFIRGLGFMYVRFCLQPSTFWDWYQPYLEDEEQIDPKAGSGDPMTIGQMVKIFLTKLEWYCTLFPRIPVPVQKDLDIKMREHNKQVYAQQAEEKEPEEVPEPKRGRDDSRGRSTSRGRSRHHSRSVERRNERTKDEHRRRTKSPADARHSKRSRSRSRSSSRRYKRNRSRSVDRKGRSSHSRAAISTRSDSKSKSSKSKRSKSRSRSPSKSSRSRDHRRHDEGGRHRSHKHGKHDREHKHHRRDSRSRDEAKRSNDKGDKGGGSSTNREKEKHHSTEEVKIDNQEEKKNLNKSLNDTEEEGELREDSRS